ncbi:MAG: 4-hydroxy-tetrahydrodipicolinate reductase [Verrucomicrobiota bacterium]|nr:4-hydroxy-tetrahydrodipicolinate reductase [Verrucomicrobiota bacterium]
MNEPLNILVTGSQGRMGMAVIDCCNNDTEVNVSGKIDVGDSINEYIDSCDVIIDFSTHKYTSDLLKESINYEKSLVIGTTGHSDDDLTSIKEASEKLSIVMAPNFSIGVNALFWLTQKTTQILGGNFDLEVIEMHHRMKIDAPSGTAKRLGEILAETRGVSYDDNTSHGRKGITGERTSKEIGMHSLRGGDVVGDHTVIYANDGERIELTHKASSRNTFANGAIHAAKWLSNRAPGLYDMQDVLELN